VALGATVVEKHYILDRKLGGTDAAFSMEPFEFKKMIENIRDTEASLGKINYDVTEKNKLRRRSLFATSDLKKGEKLTDKNIRSIRPGHGLHPKHYKNILDKRIKHDIKKGTPLSFDLISDE
jgi:pseudaminic acid synthase